MKYRDLQRQLGGMGLLLLMALANVYFVCGYRILNIGDSIDRDIVNGWCDIDFSESTVLWRECQGCPKWFSFLWDPQLCKKTDDSMANIFHFGSKDEPPYFRGTGSDEKYFTKNFLPYAIARYFDLVGPPDLVFYQAMLWDAQYLRESVHHVFPNSSLEDVNTVHSYAWNVTMANYTVNINRRFHQLREILSHNVARLNLSHHRINIGTHTVVHSSFIGNMMNGFNQILRKTAAEQNLTLFDYDHEMWSMLKWNKSGDNQNHIFKDNFHPKPILAGIVGEKLMGRRFSSALIWRGPVDTYQHRPRLCLGSSVYHQSPYHCSAALMQAQPNAYMRATAVTALVSSHNTKRSHPFHHRSAVEDSQSVFLLQYLEASGGDTRRIGPLPLTSLWQLQISPNEVFRLLSQEMERIPMARSEVQTAILKGFTADTVINSTMGHLYVFQLSTKQIHRFPYPLESLQKFGLQVSQSNTSCEWKCPTLIQQIPLDLLRLVYQVGPTISNFYHERALIKYMRTREVYVISEGKKRLIPTVTAFLRFGKDFSQVITVHDKVAFDRIPTGDPISE